MTDQTPNAPPESGEVAKPRPARRRWRWMRRAAIVLLLMLLAGEAVARFYLGLGDPPLFQTDPEIEYLFQPNQDCRRFGRRIAVNAYSMRSDSFPLHKTRADELRVLVVGDSVVNGGALTDQAELATSLLPALLSERFGRPAVVGNISAGSWGPPNQLAYLKRFGLFDADVVVLVFSGHDAFDVPTFEDQSKNPAFITRKPLLALTDGFFRYVMPRLRGAGAASNEGYTAATRPPPRADIDRCLADVRAMIALAQGAKAKVIVALHVKSEGQSSAEDSGYDLLKQTAASCGADVIELNPAFRAAMAAGDNPYRDPIHPNAKGQRIIAQALVPAIAKALERPASRPASQ